jgi:hypothetical protein
VSVTINWATVIAVVSGLAGVAGTVITPIWGTSIANSVQAVLMSVSGLLVLISGYHATAVVASTAKMKAAYKVSAQALPSVGQHAPD